MIGSKIEEFEAGKFVRMLEVDRDFTLAKCRDYFLSLLEFYSYIFTIDIVPHKEYHNTLKTFSKPRSQDQVIEILSCLNVAEKALQKKIAYFLRRRRERFAYRSNKSAT